MAGRAIAGAFGRSKKPPIKADDLKDPKRKEAKVVTKGKQSTIERNEAAIDKHQKLLKTMEKENQNYKD